MTNKKDLNNEELEKVSGGTQNKCEFIDQYNIQISIDEVNNHINEPALITCGKTPEKGWVLATLLGTYEVSKACDEPIKKLKLQIIDSGTIGTTGYYEFGYSAVWHIYIKG